MILKTHFVKTEEHIQKLYEYRYKVYSEKLRWESNLSFIEKDEFDNYSRYIICENKDNIVGCIRIILAGTNLIPKQLQLEKNIKSRYFI